MNRRALLVGINVYDRIEPKLSWCADDALAMREVLAFHANYDSNFACQVMLGAETSEGVVASRVTFNGLRAALENLLAYDGMVVFYFAGHSISINGRTYLATQDGTPSLPGLPLRGLLELTNASRARDVLLILDACGSGVLGEKETANGDDVQTFYIRPGVTLLAAAEQSQYAREVGGNGVFTRLVLGALKGGAADVRGRVSAAAIYSYVEQALGPWDQRPVYKSNATRCDTIRYCQPDVEDADLRRLPHFFRTPDHRYAMDPSFEVTHPKADPEHVAIFNLFKRYQVARLLRPTLDNHLYDAALRSHSVELTPLGQFYRQLAEANLLGDSPAFARQGRLHMPMPDAEVVARMFHEAYERLAPAFGYVTREETRVPWEQVPEHNRRLMIASAAEVLAKLFEAGDEGPASAERPAGPVAIAVDGADERPLNASSPRDDAAEV